MELRLVTRHRFQGTTKYEACYHNDSHCHQICTICGKVTEVESPEIQMAVNNMRLKRFRKDGFTLYIYGVCSSCQTRITKRKNMERRKKLEQQKAQEKAKSQGKADNQNRTKNKRTV